MHTHVENGLRPLVLASISSIEYGIGTGEGVSVASLWPLLLISLQQGFTLCPCMHLCAESGIYPFVLAFPGSIGAGDSVSVASPELLLSICV